MSVHGVNVPKLQRDIAALQTQVAALQASLAALNANNLTTGTVPLARLPQVLDLTALELPGSYLGAGQVSTSLLTAGVFQGAINWREADSNDGISQQATLAVVSGHFLLNTVGVVSLGGNGLRLVAKDAAPEEPIAGQIYFNEDGHFYGYNGVTWKQLDN